jgi:hypothetical protein
MRVRVLPAAPEFFARPRASALKAPGSQPEIFESSGFAKGFIAMWASGLSHRSFKAVIAGSNPAIATKLTVRSSVDENASVLTRMSPVRVWPEPPMCP